VCTQVLHNSYSVIGSVWNYNIDVMLLLVGIYWAGIYYDYKKKVWNIWHNSMKIKFSRSKND